MFEVSNECYQLSLNFTKDAQSVPHTTPNHTNTVNVDSKEISENEIVEKNISESVESSPGSSRNRAIIVTESTVPPEAVEDFIDNPTANESIDPGTTQSNHKSIQFNMFLFEQCLKTCMTLFLAVGIVAAAVNLARRVVANSVIANQTWAWIGLLKGIMLVMVVVLVLYCKACIHQNNNYFVALDPPNTILFYTIIVIASVFSWFHLLLLVIRNTYLPETCIVTSDYILPICEMFFIMTVLMTTSDLLFYQIRPNASKVLYAIYTSSVMLLFINCVNNVIFNLFDVVSENFQRQISKFLNLSIDIQCNSSSTFTRFMDKADPTLKVFYTIFFISCISLLISPISHLSRIMMNVPDEELLLIMPKTSQGPYMIAPKSNTLYLLVGVMVGLSTVVIVPIDIWRKNISKQKHFKVQLAFVSLPLCGYIINVCAIVYILRLLRRGHLLENITNTSFIIWISLCGNCIASLKALINSYSLLHNKRMELITVNKTFNSLFTEDVNILCMAIFCGSIIQSMLQAVFIDFIINVKAEYVIRSQYGRKMVFPTILLMSSNVAFFIINIYWTSGLTSFKIAHDPFTTIIWELLRTISDPLMIIFRGLSVLLLIRFLSNIRYSDT